jgi:SNF2 family DNA or RNA helicase
MLTIDFDNEEWEFCFNSSEGWDSTIASIYQALEEHTEHDVKEAASSGIMISFPIMFEYFEQILEIINNHESDVQFTNSGEAFFLKVRTILETEEKLSDAPTEEEINQRLEAAGWNMNIRSPSEFQIRNLQQTLRHQNAAIFSVPGAGKTLEAIAYSTASSDSTPFFFIVAPRNAFSAWEQELENTLRIKIHETIRITGSQDEIRARLMMRPGDTPYRAVLVNYNRLWTRYKAFSEYLVKTTEVGHDITMIMDESHHFKGGKAFTSAVKRVAPFASRRVILSGTPMPRSEEDLLHQFKALIPYKAGEFTVQNVTELTQGRFVRTTKQDLDLKQVEISYRAFEMDDVQKDIYEILTDFYKAEYEARGNRRALAQLTRLQKIMIYLIMHTSNPLLTNELISNTLKTANPDLSNRISKLAKKLDDFGPKVRYACKRARELAAKGKKVLIWSSFVDNVAYIADELSDLGAIYIRGDVPTIGTNEMAYLDSPSSTIDDSEETREHRIKKFKEDPDCMVMVANPAAAGEGISLHSVCHHAIYVDRTYHATEFMQSMDRIHRYGRNENNEIICKVHTTYIEILQCKNSIDSSIHSNLSRKMTAMYTWLNDPSLSPQLGMLDPFISEDEFAQIIESSV